MFNCLFGLYTVMLLILVRKSLEKRLRSFISMDLFSG